MRTIAAGWIVAVSLWLAPSALAQCAGHCGEAPPVEGGVECYCDAACVSVGDCCADAADECPLQHRAGTLCAESASDPALGLVVCSAAVVVDVAGQCESNPTPERCAQVPSVGPLGFVEFCLQNPEACVEILQGCVSDLQACIPPPECLEDPVGCLGF